MRTLTVKGIRIDDTFAEAFTNEVLIGTPGEGATLRELPILLVNVLGVKFRLIGGYAGSNEILLAIERKEVHGMCGMSWSSISMTRSLHSFLPKRRNSASHTRSS